MKENIALSNDTILGIKKWFRGYVKVFKSGDPHLLTNITLKERHTTRVCEEILGIGERLGLSDDELRIAELIEASVALQ